MLPFMLSFNCIEFCFLPLHHNLTELKFSERWFLFATFLWSNSYTAYNQLLSSLLVGSPRLNPWRLEILFSLFLLDRITKAKSMLGYLCESSASDGVRDPCCCFSTKSTTVVTNRFLLLKTVFGLSNTVK